MENEKKYMINPQTGKRIEDLRGRKFGRLEVVEFSHSDRGGVNWKCLCDCGTAIVVRRSRLTERETSNTGCETKGCKNRQIIIANSKKCTYCNSVKLLSSFYKNNKGIFVSWCKECSSIKSKIYTEKNKEKISERNKARYKKNIKERREYDKLYYIKNKEKIIESSVKYYSKNKEKILKIRRDNYCKLTQEGKVERNKKSRDWSKNNPEKRKESKQKWKKNNKTKTREYNNERRKTDIHFKIKCTTSGRLRHALRARSISKDDKSTFNILPYTVNELLKHLESLFKPKMTWENYGINGWHIDHIIPDSYFKYRSTDDRTFKMCWSLKNLQPLWGDDNNKKNNSIKFDNNTKRLLLELYLDTISYE